MSNRGFVFDNPKMGTRPSETEAKAYCDVLHWANKIPVFGARSRRRKARLVREAFAVNKAAWEPIRDRVE